MDREEDAGVDPRDDRRALPHGECERPSKHVSGAEPARFLIRQQDVAGTDCETDRGADLRVGERDLELGCGSVDAAVHHAGVRLLGGHDAGEEILEARELGERLVGRRIHDFLRRSCREHATVLEHDDPFAEREDFAMRMRDVQDGDLVRRVPGPQIVDDPRLGGVIEAGQRLVEQEDLRIGNERTRQGGALTLTA